MYIIRATPDFRSRAEAISLPAEDLTPLRPKGVWTVPFESRPELLRPEVMALVKVYNSDKYAYIAQRAKGVGKLLRFDNRLGLVYLKRELPFEGKQVSVAIVIPSPVRPPSDGDIAADSAVRKPQGTTSKTPCTQESITPKPLEQPQVERSIALENPPQRHEILIWKQAGKSVAESVVLEAGDILQIDEDETLQATGGVALILIRYNIAEVNQGGG